MSKAKRVLVDQYRLSDGGLAMITRLGHKYSFTRTYDSFEQPPDCYLGLSLDEARGLLADTLWRDVFDPD